MKQLLTLLFIGLSSLYAQTVPSYVPTSGLGGWWPFNGNANDESGNNHNGVVNLGNNGTLVYVNDRSGTPLSAIEFTSNPGWNQLGPHIELINTQNILLNSEFTINYFVSMNSSNQVGEIINKGPDNTPGVFLSRIVSGTLQNAITSGGSVNQSNFPSNTWKMVTVINSNTNQLSLFIDGALAQTSSTSPISSLASNFYFGAMPSGGSNGSYYPFQGKLDDVGFWNRALTQQEILALYFGCNDSLQLQPQNFTAYTGTGWANFKCRSTDTAATYQWQQNVGSGWANLSNVGNYTGTTSDSLVIIGVTYAMNNYSYRCIVTSCTTDTSDVAVLTVLEGIGLGESTLQKLTVSPNPTNGIVSLNTPVVGTYELLTLDGRVLETGTAKKDYDLTTYPKGVYHLRLSTHDGTRVLKVVKN